MGERGNAFVGSSQDDHGQDSVRNRRRRIRPPAARQRPVFSDSTALLRARASAPLAGGRLGQWVGRTGPAGKRRGNAQLRDQPGQARPGLLLGRSLGP
jgi:hypothetical protein